MRQFCLVLLVGLALFPYSLERTQRLGYDFPIYYSAGSGDISSSYVSGAFVYSHRIAPIFSPLSRLPYPTAFGVFYFSTLLSFAWMLAHFDRRSDVYPRVALVAKILAGGSLFVILRCGNIGGILAFLCISPVGAVLAGCVKPYLFSFVVLHAAGFCYKYSKGRALEVFGCQGQRDLHCPRPGYNGQGNQGGQE